MIKNLILIKKIKEAFELSVHTFLMLSLAHYKTIVCKYYIEERKQDHVCHSICMRVPEVLMPAFLCYRCLIGRHRLQGPLTRPHHLGHLQSLVQVLPPVGRAPQRRCIEYRCQCHWYRPTKRSAVQPKPTLVEYIS